MSDLTPSEPPQKNSEQPLARSYAKNSGGWLRRLGRWLAIIIGPALHRWLATPRQVEQLFHPEARQLLHSGEGAIIACWHESMLMLLPLGEAVGGVTCLISPSNDGQIVANAIASKGFRAIHGSSRLGGHRAVLALLAELECGRNVLVIPDGPMGPARKLKPGVLRLSAASSKSIIPVTASVNRFVRLGTWDKMVLPLWPKKLIIQYHAPLQVEADRLSQYHEKLVESLNQVS